MLPSPLEGEGPGVRGYLDRLFELIVAEVVRLQSDGMTCSDQSELSRVQLPAWVNRSSTPSP